MSIWIVAPLVGLVFVAALGIMLLAVDADISASGARGYTGTAHTPDSQPPHVHDPTRRQP